MKETNEKMLNFDKDVQNLDIKVNQLLEKDFDVQMKKLEDENEIKIVSFQLQVSEMSEQIKNNYKSMEDHMAEINVLNDTQVDGMKKQFNTRISEL